MGVIYFDHRLGAAGPIAEWSKSSDLDCGREDPGSNPGEGRNFFLLSFEMEN